jgi:hypothetical protein
MYDIQREGGGDGEQESEIVRDGISGQDTETKTKTETKDRKREHFIMPIPACSAHVQVAVARQTDH